MEERWVTVALRLLEVLVTGGKYESGADDRLASGAEAGGCEKALG